MVSERIDEMNSKQVMKMKCVCTATVAVVVAIWSGSVSHADEVCVPNNLGPDICVNKDGADPVLDVNFTVDYETDPANPSVTLLTGSLSWNVRSDDNGNPGNIGNLTIDPSQPADNFGVKIANGENPGAADVESIVLKDADPGWTGYSSLTGGQITGTLTGDLTVVQDASSTGGRLTFSIGQHAKGTITAGIVLSLSIGANASGDIEVGAFYI